MIGGQHSPSLIYDVSDPLNPRLVCAITNTSAHLLGGDSFEYLNPVSDSETDVVVRTITTGTESTAGSFPFRFDPVLNGWDVMWLPAGNLLVRTIVFSNQTDQFPFGGVQVWLYGQGPPHILFSYGVGIGDCICRFGLVPVLALSPDGQYVVAGELSGKGSQPLAVYRLSDGSRVLTADQDVGNAIWAPSGHRLFLIASGPALTETWTPESGLANVAGANAWSFVPSLSPAGDQAAYTDYIDAGSTVPRVYAYDFAAAKSRMLVDALRTQALFVKGGWVWYLEEVACSADQGCPGGTMPTGRVFAMQLSAGVEKPVTFSPGEDWYTQAGQEDWLSFTAPEFWPNS